ncbi:uncharacterized protein Sap-r [Periplaneta americana]|uniref:uncharacterized protein Sap-r n=1 Tax=Periplaneta americana TaxID=6978 RepID=UPI0037E81D30
MKLLCFVVFGLLCVSLGVNSRLLGAKECTWGPSYWCRNITNAKSCGAVKHCIQTVWEHQTLPPDEDDVCKICLEMVKEARDQLESNETQEELKEVFEGSCKLIPISIVSKECCKLADDFVPELVETLASQMNPQVVCSVAGLCNNEWVDKLLEEAKNGKDVVKPAPSIESTNSVNDCSGCRIVIDALDNRMQTMPRDEILNNMLEACGHTGSLSDGCAAVVITYFNDIFKFLQRNFKSDGVCHIAGVCSGNFHIHRPLQNIEVIHESDVGVVKPKDDVPCELCEQLVIHLRDILVANTTEQEFEQVLKGLCKQTGSFKDECLSLVNEYYAVIYDFLVNSLNAGEICKFIGICGRPGLKAKGPIWPLLPPKAVDTLQTTLQTLKPSLLLPSQPVDTIPATKIIGQDEATSYHRVPIGDNGGVVRVADVENAQLPIERMMPQSIMLVNNKEVCVFCQYFLHYVQQAITTPATEEKIEDAVKNACDKLPKTIEDQCKQFVESYGNAFIALLAEEIDPSLICPQLGLCPSVSVSIDPHHYVNDKPTCPLCLLAVQSLINELKNNKTVEAIKQELEQLCGDLPQSLSSECKSFVDKYEEILIEMLVADFTPQEICIYIKLCDAPEKPKSTTTPVPDIMSNEIPPLPSEEKTHEKQNENRLSAKQSASCEICEFVISKIDEELKDATVEAEIKDIVKNICNHLPKKMVKECNEIVDEYAEAIMAMLAVTLSPTDICSGLKFCTGKQFKHAVLIESIKKNMRECEVCEAAMGALDGLLGDPDIEQDVGQMLKKVCPILPARDQNQCNQLISVYGPSILNIISQVADPQLVCSEIAVCRWDRQRVHLLGGKKCSWGPGYWCQSVAHAKSCDTLEHCQELVWKAKKPISN